MHASGIFLLLLKERRQRRHQTDQFIVHARKPTEGKGQQLQSWHRYVGKRRVLIPPPTHILNKLSKGINLLF